MAIFRYNALTEGGRLMRGSIEAASPEQATQLLQDMKLTVNEVEKTRETTPQSSIGRSEFLLFNQQLASIAKAGIPLEKGLRQLARDAGSGRMRRLIDDLVQEMESGLTIDQAVEKRQHQFPPLYGMILKAGVETGRLSDMLTSLNRHLEIGSRTRRIIFESMAYPVVVLAIGAAIITFLFSVVVPYYAEIVRDMFYDSLAGLPFLTRLFITAAQYVVPFWIGVGLFIALFLVLYGLLTATPVGRRFKESVLLAMPILGRLYHCGILARMAEAMAVLVGAGATMPTCVRLGSASAGSETLKWEAGRLAQHIEQGEAIMEAGMECRLIPRLFLYSIQLGSQRNELQDNLHNLGQMYSDQTRSLQSRLQAILMPAMLIVVGSVVALAVIAMFLPLIKITQVLM
ncbi:MAG: type II secretion system F family protein [Sedimentisphaerales bacterium]|nr:type II secretion system F family protein [Sedimentisphaerales bacterium]